MAKATTSDADFIRGLAASRSAGGSNTSVPAQHLVMTKVPTGPSKSLEEMLSDSVGAPQVESNQSDEQQPPDQTQKISHVTNIASSTASAVAALLKFQELALHVIDDSPFQQRITYDESKIQSLGESMQAAGLQEPIVVRELLNSRFELIAGHRRLRAARMFGWATIIARVVVLDDRQAELAVLVHNDGREDLSPFERALQYNQAINKKLVKNQTEAAKYFACSQARISQCLAMLKLPEFVLNILYQRPALIGTNTAKDILHLNETYPGNEEIIMKGIDRLIDGAKEESLRQWVEQSLRRINRTLVQRAKNAVITDSDGRELYVAKIVKGNVHVEIKDTDADPEDIRKWVMAALRERMDKTEKKISEASV